MSEEEIRVEPALHEPKPEPPPGDDAELERCLRAHEREPAAELLIERHAPAIGRLCMALLGSQSEAEDALQETLLTALDVGDSFRGDGTLRAWLFGVARRKCIRLLEARQRERAHREDLAAHGAISANESRTEQQALARRARELLEQIKPSEREALLLRFGAELSFREVAAATGVDEAAARKRVSRGLSRLRALFSEEEA